MDEPNDEQTERLVNAFEGIAAGIAKYSETASQLAESTARIAEANAKQVELLAIRYAQLHELELQTAERERLRFEKEQEDAAAMAARLEAMTRRSPPATP